MEQLSQICNIAIVGGGPSGIYCALNILELFKRQNFSNYRLDIFDKGQILRTILPTGGSRCNLSNSISDIDEFISYYPRGKKFLKSLFSRHFNFDSVDFFNKIGIKTYIQDDNRIFPCSNTSKEVKDKMLSKLNSYKNVNLIHKQINSYLELGNYDKIIVSAGSRGTQELIKSFKHNLIPFEKALCELKIENHIFPKGVSVKAIDGDFIFTESGISGPLVFNISSINAYKKFPYEIEIPIIKIEDLMRMIQVNTKKSIGNIISSFLPKSLAKVIVKDFDKKASEISKKELIGYCNLKFNVIAKANSGEIVNAGGVDLAELDKNCKSRKNENVWFCGEILDIDGFCGGFNLQNCWSSAYVVAQDVVSSIINKNKEEKCTI